MSSPDDDRIDCVHFWQAVEMLAADYRLDRLSAVALLAERAVSLNVPDGDIAAFVIKTGVLPV